MKKQGGFNVAETNEGKCLLASKCKKAGDHSKCNDLCFPFVRLHGETGNGGVLGAAQVPKVFRSILLKDLPFQTDNPKAFKTIKFYVSDIVNQVEQGTGLYLHGIPSSTNPRGCGNGKSTAAASIVNEYLVARVIQDVKKERRIDDVPALFMNVSKFQNTFNAMFRGTSHLKDQATNDYYNLKTLMKKVPLLVFDDIGVRDATESFKGEFYEVIDDRSNELLANVFTSNVPTEDLTKILDDRIASRIEGAALIIPFGGQDHRRRGL